jgi:hypothetical protein
MGTVTAAGISTNVGLVPYPGQMWLGSKVDGDQQVFSKPNIHAGGIMAAGATPTITITPGSGTVANLITQSGYDMAASFQFAAGTASIFGGTLATVTFGQPLDVAPVAVIVNGAYNSGTIALGVGAINLAKTGFGISGVAPTSGGTVTVNWFVVKSPLGKT